MYYFKTQKYYDQIADLKVHLQKGQLYPYTIIY